MEAQLRVPYRDTAAHDLVWRLGEPRRPALAALELEVAGGRLELRLLGSSHQVIFTPDEAVISEVVACDWAPRVGDAGLERLSVGAEPRIDPEPGCPGGTLSLPPTAERAVHGWAYRFRSRSRHFPPHRFGHWVDLLAASLAERPDAIVGRFPGSPQAVTALLAGPDPGRTGVRWRTWHAYPQDGRLVSTATTVRPRSRVDR